MGDHMRGRAWPATETCFYSDYPIEASHRVARTRVRRRRCRKRGWGRGRGRGRREDGPSVSRDGMHFIDIHSVGLRYTSDKITRKPDGRRSGLLNHFCRNTVHKSLFCVEEIGLSPYAPLEKQITLVILEIDARGSGRSANERHFRTTLDMGRGRRMHWRASYWAFLIHGPAKV
jgi:hypothetical protein